MEQLTETQRLIVEECDSIKSLLLEKNNSYGNSAVEPIGIFSKASPEEALNIRIDDKLRRIKYGTNFGAEDTEKDLIGYLMLKRVLRRLGGSSQDDYGEKFGRLGERPKSPFRAT